MAKPSDTRKDRPSGWPPEGTGPFRFQNLCSEDLVLVILWGLVVVGLIVLAVFVFPTLFGWGPSRSDVPAAYTASLSEAPATFTTPAEQSISPAS